jgi:hypothetical protein
MGAKPTPEMVEGEGGMEERAAAAGFAGRSLVGKTLAPSSLLVGTALDASFVVEWTHGMDASFFVE